MAQSFSLKKYTSKLYAHQLLTELAKKHGAVVLLDINDQTPRKVAIEMMQDAVKSIDTAARLELMKDLSYVSSITTAHMARLGKKIFKKETGKDFEPTIECASDHDTVLYFFLHHENIADRLAFLHPFYASKSYISYEAKNMKQDEVEMQLSELRREFTRLANKEDNATELDMESAYVDDVLYLEAQFQGSYDIGQKLDSETGEMNRKHISRRIETIRIAYIPNEEIMLIAGNVSKQQKMIFLDTFLRIVCGTGSEAKVETFNLEPLKDLTLDFTTHNKGTPFIKGSIYSATVSYADGKKKVKLSFPVSRDHTGMQAFKETLEELGLDKKWNSLELINANFKFIFQNKENIEKSINVAFSLTSQKATLCPLFEYERYAKALLKNAGIYEGFKLSENNEK